MQFMTFYWLSHYGYMSQYTVIYKYGNRVIQRALVE